jgi:hypothetical protein
METRKYFYVVYKNFKRYKDNNKFYKISLTANQIEIKKKYIGKDDYKIEFFATPQGFSETVLSYIQNKFVNSSFPINVKSGELQAACNEFINKCNQIVQKKSVSLLSYQVQAPSSVVLPPPQILLSSLAQKQIILLGNKTNGEITVLCDLVPLLVDEFSAQLSQFSAFQVLDSTVMSANNAD